METKKIKIEGNEVVFKDLGIYSDDPKEDQMINDTLRKYLKSNGYKMAKIKLDIDDAKKGR